MKGVNMYVLCKLWVGIDEFGMKYLDCWLYILAWNWYAWELYHCLV